MIKPQYLYKAMCEGFNSHHGKKKWTPGKWYKVKGELEMCENGLHASERIIDAMGYVPMEILAKVEVRGDCEKQSDKQCWREMRIIRAWRWTKKDSVALAIYSAGLVLKNFEAEHPDDKRPREAINAARRWLKNSTEENRMAAGSAAESAAGSARSAAWSAWSARFAAGEEVLDKIETWIRRRISRLEEIT